ncbi:hypothetical protein, partial [Pseudomonas sp. AMR01]|uniref:hypothetical protein n=1 Tax=Pseudomonas sp. AMR01 TaxID=3064904 RepID=UPI0035C04820
STMDWPRLRPRKNLTSCPGLVDHYKLTRGGGCKRKNACPTKAAFQCSMGYLLKAFSEERESASVRFPELGQIP